MSRSCHVAAVIGFALIAAYFALPKGSIGQSVYNNVISLAFVGLIVVGVRRYRPSDSTIWWLFATGTLLSIAADSVSTTYIAVRGEAPFPSFADVLYLAAYPFYFVAVTRLGQHATTYIARERRLDGLIVALAALVLSWQPLIQAYATDDSLTLLAKLTLVAYPVMDIGVLFILLTTMFFGGRHEPVDLLIGLSFMAMVFGDIAYDLLEQNGSYASGDLIDATWLVSYLLVGVAALHPSMASTHVVTPAPTPRLWWLTMVAVASFVPSLVLLGYALFHAGINVAVFAGLTLVMAALATLRMSWMFQNLRVRTRRLQAALRERDALENELRHQAFHDPLTGVANRVLLRERIEQAMARSTREGGLIALVMCDLDGFKTINDSLGHQVGDQLLVTAARRLTAVVRPGDTVARLGGDEFAALLDGVHDPALAHQVAERLVSALREPVDVAGEQLTISTSVGVVVGNAASDADQLVSDADAAMYEAKTGGKNRYVIFAESMRLRAKERLRITNAFTGAIDRGEFFLAYQPCFSLTDGRLRNFEALLRWNHPTLGEIAPMRFISLAEETGFIVPLGRWVLETACAEAASWPTLDTRNPTLAVNISARQLADRKFASMVRGALASSGLAGDRLVLEVTENMLIADKARSVSALQELKQLGVRFAIDDFGIGYSSLVRLRELPVDFVKIDKSFVDQIVDGEPNSHPVIDAIVRLARDLDLTTVAEGIEAKAQHDLLSDLGCDIGQGFLLSRPLDRTAAGALAAQSVAPLSA